MAKLKVLLGNYPHTAALRQGFVRSPQLELEFVEAKPLNTAFRRMVRDLEFDISELSLVTFLQAKEAGKPLVLLPAVTMSRFQHPYLIYNAEKGGMRPEQLSGRRLSCRLYTANTAVWLRFILAEDYGVDLNSLRWLVFQEPHVAEFHDPPNVEKAPGGSDLLGLLFSGAADAVIVDPVPGDPRVKPVIPDPAAAAKSWAERYNAIQINHMVVAQSSLTRDNPDALREFYRLLIESRDLACAANKDLATPPMAFDAQNRRNIELAIECTYRQRLIRRRFEPEELFDEVTKSLG